jgi:hypothetical protein
VDSIAGLRAGLVHGRLTRPELRIFIRGEAEPLHLHPVRDPADAAAGLRSYPQFVRGVAARLAASGRLAAIETGSGKGWAALSTTLLALPALAMALVFGSTLLMKLPAGERWIAPLVTGPAAIALAWLCAWWWREHWPRAVRRLPDIDRMLRDP